MVVVVGVYACRNLVTSCHIVSCVFVDTGSGNGLPNNIKPFPEPILINCRLHVFLTNFYRMSPIKYAHGFTLMS